MFSVEIPKNVTEIGSFAFNYCYYLRNVAFLPNAVIGDYIFIDIEYDDDEIEDETELRNIVWFRIRNFNRIETSI